MADDDEARLKPLFDEIEQAVFGPNQRDRASSRPAKRPQPRPRTPDRDRAILEALLAKNKRPGLDIEECLAAMRMSGKSLVDFVLLKEIADDMTLAEALADFYRLPLIDRPLEALDPAVSAKEIPAAFACLHHVLAIERGSLRLLVAVEDPIASLDTIALMRVTAVSAMVAPRSWMIDAMRRVYGPSASKLAPVRWDAPWRRVEGKLDSWTDDVGEARCGMMSAEAKSGSGNSSGTGRPKLKLIKGNRE